MLGTAGFLPTAPAGLETAACNGEAVASSLCSGDCGGGDVQQGTGRLMSTCLSSHCRQANTLDAECSSQSVHAAGSAAIRCICRECVIAGPARMLKLVVKDPCWGHLNGKDGLGRGESFPATAYSPGDLLGGSRSHHSAASAECTIQDKVPVGSSKMARNSEGLERRPSPGTVGSRRAAANGLVAFCQTVCSCVMCTAEPEAATVCDS